MSFDYSRAIKEATGCDWLEAYKVEDMMNDEYGGIIRLDDPEFPLIAKELHRIMIKRRNRMQFIMSLAWSIVILSVIATFISQMFN